MNFPEHFFGEQLTFDLMSPETCACKQAVVAGFENLPGFDL